MVETNFYSKMFSLKCLEKSILSCWKKTALFPKRQPNGMSLNLQAYSTRYRPPWGPQLWVPLYLHDGGSGLRLCLSVDGPTMV